MSRAALLNLDRGCDLLRFKTDDLEVVHFLGDGSRDRLLVSFNSHITPARMAIIDKNPLKGGWQQEIEELNLPAVYIIEKKNIWFNSPDLEDAIDVVQSIRRKYLECNLVGASLGAHAAIRLSKRLGATTTIAMSPQFCIRPALVGTFENRWQIEAKQISQFDRMISSETVAGDVILIVDDEHAIDMVHVDRIAGSIDVGAVVRLPHSGHSSARAMADLDLISPMLMMRKSTSFDTLYKIKRTYDDRWLTSPVVLAIKAQRLEPEARLEFLTSVSPSSRYPRHMQMFEDLLVRTKSELAA